MTRHILLLTALAAVTARAESVSLEAWIKEYQTDRQTLEKFVSGLETPAAWEKQDAFETGWEKRLAALDTGSLDRTGMIDWLLLDGEVRSRRHDFAREKKEFAADEASAPFLQPLFTLELNRRTAPGVTEKEAAAALSTASRQAGEQLDQLRKDKEAGKPLDRSQAWRLAGRVKDAKAAVTRWYDHYATFRPGFDWWIKQPKSTLDAKLDALAGFLKKDLAGVDDDDKGSPSAFVGAPVGEAELVARLGTEMIANSPAELIAIGERELAWGAEEMKKAAAEMKMDDWKKALEAVKDDHAPPGGQDDYVRSQAEEAIAFLEKNQLVTVPPLCRSVWRVEMVGQETQKVLPYAVYGGDEVDVAFATSGMEHDAKLMSLRGNNRHGTRIVTAHELIPGHHLQMFMAARHRPDRGLFRTPFFVEGWALHWEMLLWDKGYARGPEDRIGMLFWRMHRAARIIVSLKFHLGQMKPEEMVDFLVDRVGHERSAATSEVRRFIQGGYGPLYQCGYLLGGLQLRQLHHDLVDSGKMTDLAFHDAILRLGPIPVAMVRASLQPDLPLSRSGAPWRF